MAIPTPAMRHFAHTSIRCLASSSRYTLHHPLPAASSFLTRSFSSHLDTIDIFTGTTPHAGRRRMYSVAQHLPADSAGFSNTPAPPYLSPVNSEGGEKGKGKEKVALEGPAKAAAPTPSRRTPRAQKAAIKMTPNAVAHLQALVSDPTEPKLLRIGVKTRGCAGMAYHLEYVTPPGGRFDEVVEQDGVRVLIDSKALFSIIGSTMDWRDNRLSAGFVFDNPNVVDTCGCGDSFNIR